MDSEKDSHAPQFKWPILVIGTTLTAIVVLALCTRIFENTAALRDLVFVLGSLIFLGALLATLSRICGIANALRDNSAKMEEATKSLENIRTGLMQIHHNTRISEVVRAIVFREEDRQSLQDAVFEKLKQKDFDAADEIVDEIAQRSRDRELADRLRQQVDRYRHATEEQRIEQAIAHIETLFRSCQWPKAHAHVETLIRAHPDSEKVRAMRQRLIDRKEERKRILLAAWDDAIQQRQTDRSLEILKELDLYLTPKEGLALQEAATDVFKTKLHNLGVQFAMAISHKQWDSALEVGQQTIREFPNSRMAQEIRDKLDVLQQNIQLQQA